MWIALIVGGGLLALALILLIPRVSRDDRPLPTDVETQLLLGEDPDHSAPPGDRRTDPIPPGRD